MGKIFCIIGKSGTGKDTVLSEILASHTSIKKLIPYTTRPKREEEVEGVNYHYVTIPEMERMEKDGKIVEKRAYNTVHGIWYYFTAKPEINTDENYIIITTAEALESFFSSFGKENVFVFYLYLDDKARLLRCVNREALEDTPNFSEVCRRYLADEKDFPEDYLKALPNCKFIDTDRPLKEYTKIICDEIENK